MSRQLQDWQRELLATKLYRPQARAQSIVRQRLNARFAQALAQQNKVTLVSAPAGFGKTTAVSEWLNANGKSAQAHPGASAANESLSAWLSLDEADNDPARWVIYLLAAFAQCLDEAETWNELAQTIRSSRPVFLEGILTALINTWSARVKQGPTRVLVLDDYHVITEPAIHHALAFLVERLPPHLHIVITCRTDPLLPLAHWRARGLLNEIRADDLRFTQVEAAAFLSARIGVELLPTEISTIEDRTEGWIAGLQLLALALQGQAATLTPDDTARFVQAFTGSHRFVVDYLVEEVLQRQSPETLHFLLHTCILERMNASLCNAMSGMQDSQKMLETLERANLFVTAMDQERQWYRYHPFFRQVLAVRLMAQDSAQVSEYHLRASQWFQDNALPNEAVHHAFAGQAFARAAQLVELYAQPLTNAGELVTLKRWLDQLPDSTVRAHPRLALVRADILVVEHQLAQAEEYLDNVERSLLDGRALESQDRAILDEVLIDRIFLSMIRGDLARTHELASGALARLPADNYRLRGEALLRLAAAYYWGNDPETAREFFAQAHRTSERGNDAYMAMVAKEFEGAALLDQGQLDAAVALFQQILSKAQRDGMMDAAARLVYSDYGALLYERNQLAEAADFLRQGAEHAERSNFARLLVWALAPLARVLLAQGDTQSANETIRHAEQLVEKRHLAFEYAAMTREVHIQIWLAENNLTRAVRWAETRGLRSDDQFGFPQEPEYRAWARVLIAQQAYSEALALLVRLEEFAQRGGRTRQLLAALVLQTLALRGIGDKVQARATLARALTLGEPAGFIRSFVDEGQAVQKQLAEFRTDAADQIPDDAARSRLLTYTAKILDAFADLANDPAPQAESISTPSKTAAILTPRELEVVRLLAQGASNQEIAHALTITIHTVKKHVGLIFEKLAVTNRTEAVSRAREQSLI